MVNVKNAMLRKKQTLDFVNSTTYKKLKNFYDTPSMFSLLGVSRHEDSHSRFIGWLLDPANERNDHGLGNTPFQKFLETLALVSSTLEHSIGKLPQELVTMIMFDAYEMSDVTVEVEKRLNAADRLDIYVEANLRANDRTYVLRIGIENKVKSTEHGEQTRRYHEALSTKEHENDYFVGVYLTPLLNRQYQALKEVQCSAKEFIQLNYQYFADYVLLPCLDDACKATAKQYLSEYLLALRMPECRRKGNFIMSFGKEERGLLTEFWNEHQTLLTEALAVSDKLDADSTAKLVSALVSTKGIINDNMQDKEMLRRFWQKHENLFMTALTSLADSDTLDSKERVAVADAVDIMKNTNAVTNPSALYQVKLRDGLKRGLKQRDLVNEVVLDYYRDNPESTLADLQKAFPLGVQKKLEIVLDDTQAHLQNMDGKGKPRKNYHIFDQVKLPNGAAIAICNQWGIANIESFLNHAKQKGYDISLDED